MFKDVDNHVSGDERSSKASISKTHTTPTIRSGSVMMKKKLMI